MDQPNDKSSFVKRHLFTILVMLSLVIVALFIIFFLIKNKTPEIVDNSNNTNKITEKFAAYGDTRTGHGYHQKIVDLIVKNQPLAVLHTGDLVDNGLKPDQWQTFNNIVEPIKDDLLPVLGNHENNSPLYFDNFVLPNNERWYTKEFENVTFIALDTTISIKTESEQYSWLKKTLQESDKNKFTAVFFHHPPFSTGEHEEDELGLREIIIPLFEDNGVDLVLNGHDHHYERSLNNEIYYIVVGGGGAPLRSQVRTGEYSQKFLSTYSFAIMDIDTRIEFKVYDSDNNLIDNISIVNR